MNSTKYARDKFGQRVQVGDKIHWTPTKTAEVPARVAQCREDGLIEADVVDRGRMTLRSSEIAHYESTETEQELRAR
jgi:hypothetical protein